jgi:transcriptional regulator with XRE-family HTH domain
VDSRSSELATYLRSRRARLDPADFGFEGGVRRVPGLRREELAALAGISGEYLKRLEQGRSNQVSEQVLGSLARALRLDGSEVAYLYRIALPGPSGQPDARHPQQLSESVIALLRHWSDVPAYVFDSNQDIVAINEMADVLSPGYAQFGDNIAYGAFAVLRDYPGNEGFLEIAAVSVAALRFYGDPQNRRLHEILGKLSSESVLFRQMWAEHEARPMTAGTVPISVGGSELVDFPWQILEVPGGFFMTFWPVAPGSRADELLEGIRRTRITGRDLRGPLRGWPAR